MQFPASSNQPSPPPPAAASVGTGAPSPPNAAGPVPAAAPAYPAYPAYSSTSGADENFKFDPKELLTLVLDHWLLILAILLLGTGAAAAYCILAKRIYRATCRYETFQERRLQIGQASTMDRLGRALGRQIVLMESEGLQQQILDRLKKKWAGKLTPEEMQADVTITPVRQARRSMLDISVDAVSGEYAREYLNALLEGYQEIRRQEAARANDSAVRNLRTELDRLTKDLQDAQNDLLQFQQEHNIQLTSAQEVYDEMFVTKLVQRQNAIRMERTILESQFPFLQNADAATIRDVLALTLETHAATAPSGNLLVTPGSARRPQTRIAPMVMAGGAGQNTPAWPERNDWQQQEETVAQLEAEYQDDLKIYKPHHPRMIALRRKLEAAKRDLKIKAEIALKRLKARYDALKMQESALQKAAAAWRSSLKMSAAEKATYETLQAKVEHLKTLYDTVYKRIIDASAESSDRYVSNIVNPPKILPDPIWPAKFKIMAAAIVLSLGFGLGLAFLLHVLGARHIDVMAVEQGLGVPFLCGIPDWSRLIKDFRKDKVSILMQRSSDNPATEAYRGLRVNLEPLLGDSGFALMVTSPDASEGKSLTTLNLAVAFAWAGRRVLLIDADVRRPNLHKAFNIPNEQGLADIIMGNQTDWRSVIQKTNEPNLSFLPAGRFKPEVPEHLDALTLRRILESARSDFDLIILDTAPVGRVADSVIISRACDGVLLVAYHGKSGYASIRHSLRQLAPSRVIGFCVNGIDLRKNYKSTYHQYGYAPSYHSAYAHVEEPISE